MDHHTNTASAWRGFLFGLGAGLGLAVGFTLISEASSMFWFWWYGS